ncbi:MAG: hypothetical protein ACRCYU_22655, partial [Nocardioides sp.]
DRWERDRWERDRWERDRWERDRWERDRWERDRWERDRGVWDRLGCGRGGPGGPAWLAGDRGAVVWWGVAGKCAARLAAA